MKKILLFLIILLNLIGCKDATNNSSYNKELYRNMLVYNCPNTVFIHGTLFLPVVSYLTRLFDVPLGLNFASNLSKRYGHGRVAYLLSYDSEGLFPIGNFYTFGWSGKLSFDDRKQAALDLYHYLKNLKGPINLIGHSHGGNVALLLEEVAQEHNDNNFSIDRLILLATPVQKATESYISSTRFKKAYSLYSTSDLVQILDPQGLYSKTKQVCFKNNTKKVPLFSKRVFAKSINLKQARILVDYHNVGHLDFIFNSVLIKAISKIINILDTVDYNNIHVINISKGSESGVVLNF